MPKLKYAYKSTDSLSARVEKNTLNLQNLDTAIQAAIDEQRGVPNGLALLNSNGKVLSSQLPSFVDDVQQFWYVAVNMADTKQNGYKVVIFYGLNQTSHKSLNDNLPDGSLCPHVGDAIVFGYNAIDAANPLGFPSSNIPTANGFITANITLTDEKGDHWKGDFSFDPTVCRSARIASVNTSAYSFTLSASEPYDLAEGKIYVEIYTNKTYRYSKNATISKLVEISESLALGSTSGTAFDGARGQALENTVSGMLSGSRTVKKAETVAHPLTINGITYDGSESVNITTAGKSSICYLGETFLPLAEPYASSLSIGSEDFPIQASISIYCNSSKTKFIYDILQWSGSANKPIFNKKDIKIALTSIGTFWWNKWPKAIKLYGAFDSVSMRRAILLSCDFGLFKVSDGSEFNFNGNGMPMHYMLENPDGNGVVKPLLNIYAGELDTDNKGTDLYLDRLYVRLYVEKA